MPFKNSIVFLLVIFYFELAAHQVTRKIKWLFVIYNIAWANYVAGLFPPETATKVCSRPRRRI